MSQRNKDKGARGRAPVVHSPAVSPTRAADNNRHETPPDNNSVTMATVGSQTETDSIMEQILARLDNIEAQNKQCLELGNDYKKEQSELKVKLEDHIKESREMWDECNRKLMIAERQFNTAQEMNRRTETHMNAIDNQSRICNIRIEGKKEENGENLMKFVLDVANQVGVTNIAPNDIMQVYRLGKPAVENQRQRNTRPRTILVTFVNKQVRNRLYFARAKLHQVDQYKGIFVNDDVTLTTRRHRDEYRSVAALARAQGADIRIHDDGLIINGIKYMLGESHTLPSEFSMAKARTVESDGELYFASQYSYLSNFSPAVIVHEDIVYQTAEHFYQAEKCLHAQDESRRKQVIAAITPLEAKRIADDIKSTPEWRNVRDEVMKTVLEEKFKQNQSLANKLLTTGDMILNEATNNQHFGIGVSINSREIRDKSYKGNNMLGQLLMKLRTDLKVE